MNFFNVKEIPGEKTHQIIVSFNYLEFGKGTPEQTGINFSVSFQGVSIQHLHKLKSTYYSKDILLNSIQKDISFLCSSEELMKKILDILKDVNSMSEEIFHTEIKGQSKIIPTTTFTTILDKYFSYAVLKNMLPQDAPAIKKRNKI